MANGALKLVQLLYYVNGKARRTMMNRYIRIVLISFQLSALLNVMQIVDAVKSTTHVPTSVERAEIRFADIWNDAVEPPIEFELDELNLDVNEIDPECPLDDSLEPLFQLPINLLPDMFYSSGCEYESNTDSLKVISESFWFWKTKSLELYFYRTKYQFNSYVANVFKTATTTALKQIRRKLDNISFFFKAAIIPPRESWKNLTCNERIRSCMKNVTVELEGLQNSFATCINMASQVLNNRRTTVQQIESKIADAPDQFESCRTRWFQYWCLGDPKETMHSAANFVLSNGPKHNEELAKTTREIESCIDGKAQNGYATMRVISEKYQKCIEL